MPVASSQHVGHLCVSKACFSTSWRFVECGWVAHIISPSLFKQRWLFSRAARPLAFLYPSYMPCLLFPCYLRTASWSSPRHIILMLRPTWNRPGVFSRPFLCICQWKRHLRAVAVAFIFILACYHWKWRKDGWQSIQASRRSIHCQP